MKLAIISDLHLGRQDRTDRFGHSAAAFHDFLDYLEASADEVVLLGDIVDTHHGRIPLAFFREVHLISGLYRGLYDRLLGGRYRVVAGNHDSCLLELPGIAPELTLTADGRRVHLRHGHQFDRLIKLSPTLCALGNYLGGAAERRGISGALALLDWIDDKANGLSEDRSAIYRRRAMALARREGYDIVVLGHTHQQDRAEDGPHTYVNVGACLQGRFEYGFVDTSTGLAEARTWP